MSPSPARQGAASESWREDLLLISVLVVPVFFGGAVMLAPRWFILAGLVPVALCLYAGLRRAAGSPSWRPRNAGSKIVMVVLALGVLVFWMVVLTLMVLTRAPMVIAGAGVMIMSWISLGFGWGGGWVIGAIDGSVGGGIEPISGPSSSPRE